MNKGQILRELINDKNTYCLPGTFDCIGARVAEQVGFKALTVSGNAVAASSFGLPDLGLITMSEVADISAKIASSVSIPVIADSDTGYGPPLTFARAVSMFEMGGLAGIHIEDQVSPKKCAYYGGLHEVVAVDEQVRKIKAGLEARCNKDFCIIARTDALVSFGINEAIMRANMYLEAGADAAFVVGCKRMDEIEKLAKAIQGPLMITINDDSDLNRFTAEDFNAIGVKFVLYAASLRASYLHQAKKVMSLLSQNGNTYACREEISDSGEFQKMIGLEKSQSFEYKYSKD